MDVPILLIEDSPTDAAILSAAFDDIGCPGSLQVVQTADEALRLLQQIDHESYAYPRLILLDLNLPGKTGHDVLETIKCHKIWSAIPTIVLSSSAMPRDIYKSYQLQANSYITKPSNFSEYRSIAEKISDFWLKTIRLPTRE